MPLSLWKQLLKNPRAIGTVAPSSAALSRAMANEAKGLARVLELGAGTGPVTRALLERFPAQAITSVEMQPALCRQLRKRFPDVRVVEGDALEALKALDAEVATAVVSSLPFRSLPLEVAQGLVREAARMLRRCPGSRWIQFTYHPKEPFEAPVGWGWRRAALVFTNLPPARVWVLEPAAGGH